MSSSANESLAALEKNIVALLHERESLLEEVARLHDDNERQRQEMIRTHEELSVLRRDYNHLRAAHAMTEDSPERDKVRRQLTHMITLIDKVIDNLKRADS